MTGETLRVAEYATSLRYTDLPPSVIERAKQLVLDQLACQVGVSSKPWLKLAATYVIGLGGNPDATIVGSSQRTNAENAAFVNGAFGHGFEVDDAYPPGLIHPGAVIVPAALAAAEREGRSGREFLLAVIIGYDVMGRVGCALSPTQLYRGFHPTSAAGPIGAAAAVGRLIGLDQSQMVNALAISASHCGGLTECYKSGGEIKRYHSGIAAAAGIRSAGLARLGLTGPSTVLEGPLGIRAMCDDFKPEALVDGLGAWHLVDRVWIKKYCNNGMLHAPLDALQAIQSRRRFGVDDVQRIVVGSNRHAINEVGSIAVPKDVFGLQFSIAHALAMHLVYGDTGLRHYVEATLHDRQLADVAKRVSIETDSEIDRLFPQKVGGKVRLEFHDGSTECETVEDARGTPGNPMSSGELRDKIHRVASLVMAPERVDQLIAAVAAIDQQDDLHGLTRVLAA